METFRLISMTDFVLEQREKRHKDNIRSFWICEKYAKFLKQPLKLEMFVPCDDEGNVLEKPKISCATCEKCTCSSDYIKLYDKAKEKVLFETNYELHVIKDILTSAKIIEDLVTCSKLNITLTPNAIKQLVL